MAKDQLSMSKKELTRLEIIQKAEVKRLKQREVADILGMSERHVRRLLHAYRQKGAEGLISRKRGKPSNNRLESESKQQAIDLLHSQYHDFGPTLAHEKLHEKHNLRISVESVRQIMMAEGLWKPRKAQALSVHPMRERRACIGELVQIDGSPHAWFEGRAPDCTLLVYIDDASGKLVELHFTPSETTFSYFQASRQYLVRYGRPLAFYSDKNSIFKVNIPNALSGSGMTQFGRAMKALDIEIICAHSPQAKGRVERVISTLQDRLVKELRLQNISTIAAANAFAPEFIQDFNRRFSVHPRSSHNAHRQLLLSETELDQVFSHQETRSLSKNLTIQYKKVIYQIQTKRPTYALRKAQVTVCEQPTGEIAILYKGKPLDFTIHHKQVKQAEVVSAKSLNHKLDQLDKPTKPAVNHPWRTYGHHLNGKPIKPPISHDVSS